MRRFSDFWLLYVFFIVLRQFLGCTAFDCSEVTVGKKTFNFDPLKKLRFVRDLEWIKSIVGKPSPAIENTTYYINICEPLHYDQNLGKDTCDDGTNICVVTNYTKGDKWMIADVKQIVTNSTDFQATYYESKEGERIFS
ncbi:29596_t:CDS:2 [Racocetra persica]|uniref:29596_t:CDS:1 n=1 Tax=Racocetra persica TaxID=160502 RepID=A0ACA9L714_9GLOM|nr:29596_t:CDS:2 [Racocetra persica]